MVPAESVEVDYSNIASATHQSNNYIFLKTINRNLPMMEKGGSLHSPRSMRSVRLDGRAHSW